MLVGFKYPRISVTCAGYMFVPTPLPYLSEMLQQMRCMIGVGVHAHFNKNNTACSSLIQN